MAHTLKTKRGASMLWVVCLMCVVLIIGGSILTAGAISSGVALRYREAKNCYNYATTLADLLIDDIESAIPTDATDPWRSVAQGVYDAQINKSTNAVLKNIELNVDFTASELDPAPVTEMEVTLSNQFVEVSPQYNVVEPDEGEPGEPIITLEAADVQFIMIIELRTSIGDQKHVVFLKFKFRGTTLGTDAGPGTGQINSGEFRYDGAFDSAP